MPKQLILGARSSVLSKLQAHTVGKALLRHNKGIKVQYHFKESQGDKDLTTPLWKTAGQGIFTKDLQEDLLSGKIDAIIHSWKDLDLTERKGTKVISVLPRADQRDVLLFKRSKWIHSPETLYFLTSSPRREHNLSVFFKEFLPTPLSHLPIKFESVRGNIQTRIKKFLEMDVSGIVLAKAALDRLLDSSSLDEDIPELKETRNFLRESLNQCLFIVLPLSQNPNAPAQSAPCAEIREEDTDILSFFETLKDANTELSVVKERNILKNYGGGCHQKIGVSILQKAYGEVQFLRGETEEGEKIGKKEISNLFHSRFSKEEVWPPLAKMAARQRERLGYRVPDKSDIFVSRGYAFPLDLSVNPSQQILWAAGLSTWKDLSKRGFWVHGTADGLGEAEDPNIHILLGKKPNFIKLSHAESDTSYSTYPLVATYLVSAPEIPIEFQPEKVKAAYWRSGSEFEIITKRFPELKNVIHFVGPGSTYIKIKRALGEAGEGKVFVSLSFEHWVENYISKEK
ncbi:hydroxymethylbilane synthase [Leptospira idonii]|uniref:hydroxymethylbilane synthase n=1 Tax=Leptospira idonii TaxID=1193500 RepID=A0A4R9M1C5_9LEPT|nr:hydroxymethylbilane synthase [Leptospira idonii]TGN20554.1 hydroxymethylbilane synthase [Leptospira idonii]